MEKLIAWLDANAFDGAYVTLVADVPELYAKFGLKAFARKAKGCPRLANPESLTRVSCQEKSVVQMATRLAARSSLC
jgi:hypothetical protein